MLRSRYSAVLEDGGSDEQWERVAALAPNTHGLTVL